KNAIQNLDNSHKAFLPRMRSTEEPHRINYMKYTGVLDFKINPNYDFTEDIFRMDLGIDPDSLTEDDLFEVTRMLKQNIQENINQFRQAYEMGRVDEADYDQFLRELGDIIIVEKPSFAA